MLNKLTDQYSIFILRDVGDGKTCFAYQAKIDNLTICLFTSQLGCCHPFCKTIYKERGVFNDRTYVTDKLLKAFFMALDLYLMHDCLFKRDVLTIYQPRSGEINHMHGKYLRRLYFTKMTNTGPGKARFIAFEVAPMVPALSERRGYNCSHYSNLDNEWYKLPLHIRMKIVQLADINCESKYELLRFECDCLATLLEHEERPSHCGAMLPSEASLEIEITGVDDVHQWPILPARKKPCLCSSLLWYDGSLMQSAIDMFHSIKQCEIVDDEYYIVVD